MTLREMPPKGEILLFGGRNHPNPQGRPESEWFEQAVMLKLRDGRIVGRVEYSGPEDQQINVNPCFRAATIVGQHAWTCTGTEILKIDLERMAISERHTHRLFNDCHHIAVVGDHYFVASTGTDSVIELDASFQLVRRYPIAGDEVLSRYGAESDFRKIRNTKPHSAHPNFVQGWADDVWVTNFQYGRVEALKSQRRHVLSEHRVHDGAPAFDRIWFTAVNGTVIRLDPRDGKLDSVELAPMTRTDRSLGWCRGIAPLGAEDVLVGFSKLRETKARENLKWLGNKLLKQNFVISLPTRVARYDLARGVETWRFDLDEHGMDAVFSIHSV